MRFNYVEMIIYYLIMDFLLAYKRLYVNILLP